MVCDSYSRWTAREPGQYLVVYQIILLLYHYYWLLPSSAADCFLPERNLGSRLVPVGTIHTHLTQEAICNGRLCQRLLRNLRISKQSILLYWWFCEVINGTYQLGFTRLDLLKAMLFFTDNTVSLPVILSNKLYAQGVYSTHKLMRLGNGSIFPIWWEFTLVKRSLKN